MRSIWKGIVSFGLVSVPVKLYGATEDHDVKAHQVHTADGGRIRYKKVCEECDTQVGGQDISKGYEYEKQLVILTDEEINSIAGEANRTVEVLEFVPADDIDTMLYDKPYFIAPEKGAEKAYLLLASALAQSDRVGIVRFAMRGRSRLAALRVTGKQSNVLVVHVLRWPDEVRELELQQLRDVTVKDAELAMAGQLIEAMANEFNSDRYRDTYQEELRELVAAKAEGGFELPPSEDEVGTEEVADLLAKLEASIQGARK